MPLLKCVGQQSDNCFWQRPPRTQITGRKDGVRQWYG
jgi:hypothetical protein